MIKPILILYLLSIMTLYVPCTMASNGVVVIPLGGSKNYIYWKGEWATNTKYKVGDGVQYKGSSYLCVQEHKSIASNSPPSIKWDVLAIKGDKGDSGLITDRLGLYDNDGQFIGYSTGIVYTNQVGTASWYWGFYNPDLKLSGLISIYGSFVNPQAFTSSTYYYYTGVDCTGTTLREYDYIAANLLGSDYYFTPDKRDISYKSFKSSPSAICNSSGGTFNSYEKIDVDALDLPFTLPLSLPLVVHPIP